MPGRVHEPSPSMPVPKLATVRIGVLLAMLAGAALVSAHQRFYSRNWNQTLPVFVYPVNGDGHLATARYIRELKQADFAIIDRWAVREARRHGLDLAQPVAVTLAEPIRTLPPAWPGVDPNAVDVMFWGLRFRWWVLRHAPADTGKITRIRMFVVYYEGNDDRPLPHSLGMQKGLLGLVHAYAHYSQTAQNNIVVAHEMLHTVGAMDKYSADGSPQYPAGFANPSRRPLYPQRNAEIMAGRIPTSSYSSYMAESLNSVIINRQTAIEINWIR